LALNNMPSMPHATPVSAAAMARLFPREEPRREVRSAFRAPDLCGDNAQSREKN
jgi:hypothetical protein